MTDLAELKALAEAAVPHPFKGYDASAVRTLAAHADADCILSLIERVERAEADLFAARNELLSAAIDAEQRGYQRGMEDAAKVCDQTEAGFLSMEYAGADPLNSFDERFGASQCAQAIRAKAKGV